MTSSPDNTVNAVMLLNSVIDLVPFSVQVIFLRSYPGNFTSTGSASPKGEGVHYNDKTKNYKNFGMILSIINKKKQPPAGSVVAW